MMSRLSVCCVLKARIMGNDEVATVGCTDGSCLSFHDLVVAFALGFATLGCLTSNLCSAHARFSFAFVKGDEFMPLGTTPENSILTRRPSRLARIMR